MGACIGYCPEGAITTEEREAEPYDENKVMENIVTQGKSVIKAHLEHLRAHNETVFFEHAMNFLKKKNMKISLGWEPPSDKHAHAPGFAGCPGLKVMDFKEEMSPLRKKKLASKGIPQLRQWPVQIKLIPTFAPYFKDADLLVAADCVPFAYADFHEDLLKGKVLLVGCPKLDDAQLYIEKIAQILKDNNIKSITCAHMEVPCCFGLIKIVKEAISLSGKNIPFEEVTISIRGDVK